MDTTTIRIGTQVSYEDMANPRRTGTVVEIVTPRWGGDEYRIQWAHGGEGWSNLAQPGWRIEDPEPWYDPSMDNGDGGLYACAVCDTRLAYYTWETGDGLCPDCAEEA